MAHHDDGDYDVTSGATDSIIEHTKPGLEKYNCQSQAAEVMETQNLLLHKSIKQEPECETTTRIPPQAAEIKLEPDDDGYTTLKKKVDSEEDQHMSPVRKKARINSTSQTYSSKEIVYYCDKCQMKCEGDCSEHEPLIYVDSTESVHGQGGCSQVVSTGPAQVAGNKGRKQKDEEQHSSDKQPVTKAEPLLKLHKDVCDGPGRPGSLSDVAYSHSTGSVNKCVDFGSSVSTMVEDNKGESGVAEDKSPEDSVGHQDTVKDEREAHSDDGGTLENGVSCLESEKVFSECEMSSQYSEPGGSGRPHINWNSKKYRKMLNSNRRFKCGLCGVGFHRGSDLSKHNRTHTGEKPYKCDICGTGFAQSSPLKTHKRIHTGEKPYKCDVCGVGFYNGSHLKTHSRIHTGEKPYKCDVCGAGFSDCSHLRTHNRIHTGEKPYKCDVCEVRFAQCSDLRRHVRIHTGEKPYKCEFCGVGFAQSSPLVKHKRIHTGEKPYKCEVCGAGFTGCSDLKQHIRTHTGEKPYKCDICGVGFVGGSVLKKHKRTHTREKPHKCEVCGVGFTKGSDLKSHIRVHAAVVQ